MRLAAAILFGFGLGWSSIANAQSENDTNVQSGDNIAVPAVEEPKANDNANEDTKADAEKPRLLSDDTLLITDEEREAIAKAKADAVEAAKTAELDKQLLGSWGRISARGAAGISDASILVGVNQCLRTRKITKPEYAKDAEKVLPAKSDRRGNLVFYRTKTGLHRLDTALRKVLFISKVEKRLRKKGQPPVWKVGTTKGSVLLGFGTVRRKGRKFPVLIEQNAVYIRCSKPKADG